MEDIGKELCERVREVFEQRNSSNAFMVRLKDEIARGTATMRDTSLYSQTLGINLRRAIREVVTPDELPDSTLYYNIAYSILEPLLRDTYEDVNAVCAEVQRKLDDKVGIHLAPQKADFPAERVRAACGSASVKDTAEHGIEVLERTSENITAAFSDDYMKANADFRSRAGLDTYIERRDDGKCCPWCTAIAGRYQYGTEPHDIYRRHDNCGCTVEYVSSRGRQNVWSKKWQEPEGTIKDELSSLKKVLTKQDNNAKIDIVESALGISKSAPMSIENAVKGANPNYNVDRKYRVNCQRCVQAYELRRRGYNVEALPKPKGRSYISWGNECFIDSKTALSDRADSFFEMRQYKQDIFDKLADSPDGSRHVIYAQWKRGGAHVFVAEKENGVIKFVDPQSGKMDCSSHFDNAADGKYGIFRLDDKDLTDNSNILKKTVKGS